VADVSVTGCDDVRFGARLQFVNRLADKDVSMRVLVPMLVALLLPSTGFADRMDDLIGKLQERSFKVRVQAALLLGTQTKLANRAVPPLVKGLGDRHRAVRAACAMALGRLGEVAALPALSAALEDDDRTVVRSAKDAMGKVVKSFVRNRGPFTQTHYNITIAGLRDATGNGYTGAFKDTALETLLNLDLVNLTVGAGASFDEGETKRVPTRRVELDLSGDIVSLSAKRCTLKLVLALRPGGYVIHSWKAITGKGKTMEEALRTAANAAVQRLLHFLGK